MKPRVETDRGDIVAQGTLFLRPGGYARVAAVHETAVRFAAAPDVKVSNVEPDWRIETPNDEHTLEVELHCVPAHPAVSLWEVAQELDRAFLMVDEPSGQKLLVDLWVTAIGRERSSLTRVDYVVYLSQAKEG